MKNANRGQTEPFWPLVMLVIGSALGLSLSAYLGLGEYPTVATTITAALVLPFAFVYIFQPSPEEDQPDDPAGN